MTAFRHNSFTTLHHTVQSKWKCNGRKWRQRSTPTDDYYITHSMNVQDDVLYNARRCTATTLNLRFI